MYKINPEIEASYSFLLNNKNSFYWVCKRCGKEHKETEARNFFRRKYKCSCQRIQEQKENIQKRILQYGFIFLDTKFQSYSLTKQGVIDTKKPIMVQCLYCNKITMENLNNIVKNRKKCNCNKTKKFTRGLTNQEFVEKWHWLNKQNFVLVENQVYKNRNTKYKIRCKKCGREDIRWGITLIDRAIRCKYCSTCSTMEKTISELLKEYKISFIREFPIYTSYSIYPYRLDFYCPQQRIGIEYNGEQHYKAMDYFGGEKRLEQQRTHDMIKQQYCKEHNIHLIIFNYKQTEQEINKKLGIIFNDYCESK